MLHYNRQYLTVAADTYIEVPEQRNVLELDLTPATAKRILREIIDADDARVFFTGHAETRMVERGITHKQVLRCLRNGQFAEGPYRGIQGNWEMKLEQISAGDVVSVVAALDYDDDRNITIVITTY